MVVDSKFNVEGGFKNIKGGGTWGVRTSKLLRGHGDAAENPQSLRKESQEAVKDNMGGTQGVLHAKTFRQVRKKKIVVTRVGRSVRNIWVHAGTSIVQHVEKRLKGVRETIRRQLGYLRGAAKLQ